MRTITPTPDFIRLMRSGYSRLLLTLLLTMTFCTFSAQTIGDRAKDRSTEKATNRVDNRIDQGVDKSLDAIEGLFKRKKKKEVETTPSDTRADETTESRTAQESAPSTETNAAFSQILASAEVESQYSFDLGMDMVSETIKKNGKSEKTEMSMYFAEDIWAMGIPDQGKTLEVAYVIYDMPNGSMITLSEKKGKKEGMAMNMPKSILEAMSEKVEEQTVDLTIHKTGRTKQLLGYTCDEYEIEDAEMSATIWSTSELKNGMGGLMKMFSQNSKQGMPAGYPDGMMLESHGTYKKNGEQWKWTVTRVDSPASTQFSMKEWQVKDLMGQSKY